MSVLESHFNNVAGLTAYFLAILVQKYFEVKSLADVV